MTKKLRLTICDDTIDRCINFCRTQFGILRVERFHSITLIMDMNIMEVTEATVIMGAMDIIIPITQVTIMAIHIIEMQIMEKGQPRVPDPRDTQQQIPLFAIAIRIKQRV